MVSAYRCTGMQCHALELPSECDLSACEQFGYPIASVWQPDEQCFSLWGHGRCKVGEGHQHYVSERPFGGTVEWGCGQRTCCSKSTVPPSGFVAGVPDIYYVCSEAEVHEGIICEQQESCKFFAPIFLIASIWAVLCTLVICVFVSKVNVAAHDLRSTFDERAIGMQTVGEGQHQTDLTPGRVVPVLVTSELDTGSAVACPQPTACRAAGLPPSP